MTRCCERPEPRILESNGRLFCRNCRRYLDALPPEVLKTPQAAPDDLRDADPPEARIASTEPEGDSQ